MNIGSTRVQQFQDSPDHSDASAPLKPQRVLACNHCQQRKIKCNRVFPCNNCMKANVICVPSTPAPARKRRAPNVLLQERIKKLEALLEQYTHDSPGQASDTTPLAQDPAESSSRSSPDQSPRFSDQKLSGPGKLVVRNGGYKFLDSYIWSTIHDNLLEMRHILDADTSDDENYHSCDSPVPHEDVDLLLAQTSSLQLSDDVPLPFQIFRLWQVFLNRVNPLTKIIHTPTAEHVVISAMTDHAAVSNKSRALLFAIYLLSVISLTDQEAMSMLGLRKDEAIQRFTKGLKTALNKVNFLRNYDMVVLQALVLYMISLQGRSNHDAVWVLSGAVIRIAHKLGVHRDGETLGLTPFDTEVRRRVWWQILILDSMYATTSGMKPTILPSVSDTKIPTNINDADFSPDSTVIQPREGPTEMVFLMVVCQVIQFIRDHPIHDIEHLLLGGQDVEPGTAEYHAHQESLNKLRLVAEEFDTNMRQVEKDYCDPSGGPLHVLALSLRPHMLKEARTMATPYHETPEWGTEVNNSHDNFFRIWLSHNENAVSLYEISSHGNFLYAFKSHFHLDSLLFLAGQLVDRSPVGSFPERTWRLFDRFYCYHDELWNVTQRLHMHLARLLLKAWDARETALLQIDAPIDTPTCVPKLKMAVSQAGLLSLNQRSISSQFMDGSNQGSQFGQMQIPGDILPEISQNSQVPGDWSMLDDCQIMDSQNPVLPLFGFFNTSGSW